MGVEERRKSESERLKRLAERVEEEFEKRDEERLIIFAEVLARAEETKYLTIPGLGRLPYKELTLADFAEIQAVRRKDETGVETAKLMLYKMWSKADPTVTLEGIEKLPLSLITEIMAKIAPKVTSPLRRGSEGSPEAT